MIRSFVSAAILILLAGPASAQSLDGTWLLFDDPVDPDLSRLASAGGRSPAAEIEQIRRLEVTGTVATFRHNDATVTMTVAITPTAWGFDAAISAIEGSNAPITYLRIEIDDNGPGTLTSYSGQVPLEQFAILKAQPDG